MIEDAGDVGPMGVTVDLSDPAADPGRLRQRVRALRELAGNLQAQGENGQAEPLYLQALALTDESFERDDPELGSIMRSLAILYQATGRVDEAERLWRRALAVSEAAWGPRSYEVAFDCCQLAAVLVARGVRAEAGELYERALEVKRNVLDPRHPVLTGTLHNLAILRDAEGRSEDARSLWAEARAALESPPDARGGDGGQTGAGDHLVVPRASGRAAQNGEPDCKP